MTHKEQTGFTLLETMVSLVVLLAVSAIVMGGMNQMMKTQGTVANRTEMHTSVRSATELLELGIKRVVSKDVAHTRILLWRIPLPRKYHEGTTKLPCCH